MKKIMAILILLFSFNTVKAQYLFDVTDDHQSGKIYVSMYVARPFCTVYTKLPQLKYKQWNGQSYPYYEYVEIQIHNRLNNHMTVAFITDSSEIWQKHGKIDYYRTGKTDTLKYDVKLIEMFRQLDNFILWSRDYAKTKKDHLHRKESSSDFKRLYRLH